MLIKYSACVTWWTFIAFGLLQMANCELSGRNEIIDEVGTRDSFTTEFFAKVSSIYDNTNVVFSPISLQSAIAVAILGAGGKTANELREILRLDDVSRSNIAASVKQITEDEEDNEELAFHVGIKIFLKRQAKICKEFERLRFQIESIDFYNDKAAVKKINRWVKEQTGNKMKEIIEVNSLGSDTSAILANVAYLKGKWKQPFNKKLTKKALFHINRNEATHVDMMTADGQMQYANLVRLDASVLQLPYNNSRVTMLIFLPNDIYGLRSLEYKLTPDQIKNARNRLEVRYVKYDIPKFRIETDLDVRPILEEMGASTMYEDNADFSRLVCNDRIEFDRMKHKVLIEVSEEGSNAAGRPRLGQARTNWSPKPIVFKADHPFVFLISDPEKTYFLGHVTFD